MVMIVPKSPLEVGARIDILIQSQVLALRVFFETTEYLEWERGVDLRR